MYTSFEGTRLSATSRPAIRHDATGPDSPAHVLYTSPSFTLRGRHTDAAPSRLREGIQPFSLTVLNDTTTVFGTRACRPVFA
jgi:hypothetical protein